MTAWSREEVEATVTDYFAMLEAELRGQPYSKAQHNRNLQALLTNRSPQAIEFKHANISAVLIELGYPYIDGYKPRRNYQDLLRDVIVERLGETREIDAAAEALVESPVIAPPSIADILAIRVDPPVRKKTSTIQGRERARMLRPLVDYAERDQRNRALGKLGEELVMKYECTRLHQAGQKKLADRIEQVSATKGGQPGYDIYSFEETGAPRLIEVKTTRLAAMTPFYATRNEVQVSAENAREYHLYRVYTFMKEPQFFVLDGALEDTCELDPANYIARIA